MSLYRVSGPQLWTALNTQRERQGLSWRGVARETGVPQPLFTYLKDGRRSVHADTLVTLLMWLNADYRTFTVQADPRYDE